VLKLIDAIEVLGGAIHLSAGVSPMTVGCVLGNYKIGNVGPACFFTEYRRRFLPSKAPPAILSNSEWSALLVCYC
jgi:hypothetical protein